MKRSKTAKRRNTRIFFRSLIISGAVWFFVALSLYGIITITENMLKALYGIDIYAQFVNFFERVLNK